MLQTTLQLSEIEQSELAQHEAVIERGLKTFVDVGLALLAIRDGRLYRDGFGTFEDYCRERWGMARTYSFYVIESAKAVNNLLVHNCERLPENEAQARPLTELKPEQQAQAWAWAVETAPDGKITGAHVQAVVDEIKQKPHVSHNSGNNEWYTPAEYIEAARRVMGGIDLDPASSDIANETVGAAVYFTADDDGLRYAWDGRVWMNPPYASELIGKFADKLVAHFGLGDVTQAVVLVNNATETGWFQTLLGCASAVCFTKGRIKFIDMDGNPSGAPLQGQAVLYLGDNPGLFSDCFSGFGAVLWTTKTAAR